MGFTKPNFPPVEPAEFLQKPLMERMKLLALNWVENGYGAPTMVHTIYIAKLLFCYVLGGVTVATWTSGLPAFWHVADWWNQPIVTRRPSCGRCCWRRSGWPGRGDRWPARPSR